VTVADVKVIVVNKSGKTVGLTLDDERDAERIEYLKKQVKADVLESVKVEKPSTRKPAPQQD
jgi:hypothetical protein